MAQCAQCGEEIQGRPVEYDGKQFCSQECVDQYRRDNEEPETV